MIRYPGPTFAERPAYEADLPEAARPNPNRWLGAVFRGRPRRRIALTPGDGVLAVT
jgi:hypothetical protein